MRHAIWGIVAALALWACGGQTFAGPGDGGGDGGSSSSSSGGSSGGSGSSSGASSSGSGGSSSGSGGSSSGGSSSGSGSGSGSGSSSGGVPPVNHRPDDSQCLQPAPPGYCDFGGGGGVSCTNDSQCVDAGVNGRCVNFGGGPAGCFCTTDTCADDGACSPGTTCACHGSPYNTNRGNTCIQGNCRVDHDCGPGGWCSPSSDTMSCGGIGGYYCHTAQDECVNDSDCADAGFYELCAFDATVHHWRCMMQGLCAAPQR